MSLLIFSVFGWLLNKKAAWVEVDISLAFLYLVGIALHSCPFISDIAIFVLKRDVKLQLTNSGCSFIDMCHLNMLTYFNKLYEFHC